MFILETDADRDWPEVWAILEPVFRAGTTFPFAPHITEAEAYRAWIEQPSATYVCRDASGRALGTYYIKPNQPALGAHVCNGGYAVHTWARRQGVGSAMARHAEEQAVRLGFRAMQYNLVVSTNPGALRLWQRLGLHVVGILPKAFQHPEHGDVDAYVLYKNLTI